MLAVVLLMMTIDDHLKLETYLSVTRFGVLYDFKCLMVLKDCERNLADCDYNRNEKLISNIIS